MNKSLVVGLFLGLIFSGVANAQYTDSFVNRIFDKPYETFIEVSKRLEGAEFHFNEMIPFLEDVITRLEKRESPNRVVLVSEAKQLIEAKVPYKPFIRFTFAYVQELDRLARSKQKDLAPNHFQKKIEGMLESMLSQFPRTILFPSFANLDMRYFIKVRSVPFCVVGVSEEPVFADSFTLSPAEFAYHDLDHCRYLLDQDNTVFNRKDTSIITAVSKWYENSKFVFSKIESAQFNKDFAKALKSFMFELFHEKSFNWDLRDLSIELASHAHLEKIIKKSEYQFFSKGQFLKSEQVQLLPDAEKWLANVVQQKIEQDAKTFVEKHLDQEIEFEYVLPQFRWEIGKVQSIEFNEYGRAATTINGKPLNQYQFGTPPRNVDSLRTEQVETLEKLMWLKLFEGYDQPSLAVKRILLNKDGSLQVEWLNSKREERISSLSIPLPVERPRLTVSDLAKVNYFFDAWIRNEEVRYPVTPRPQILRGRLLSLGSGIAGKTTVRYYDLTRNEVLELDLAGFFSLL